MSTRLAIRGAEPLPEAMEKVLVHGDLKQLNTEQRLKYYVSQCEASGLDPRTRPFEYVEFKGKLTLYARKQCAEALNALHGISHNIIESRIDKENQLIEVTVQASMGSRTTVDVGIVNIQGLKGDDLANAKMKAMTKAKRRATLSLCGLGNIPDETELETISEVRPCTPTGMPQLPDNGSNHAKGTYAGPEQTAKWLARADKFLTDRRQRWLDFWSGRFNGDLPPKFPEDACPIFQLDNHLVKWATKVGHLKPAAYQDGITRHQLGTLTAILFFRDKQTQAELIEEARRYVQEQEDVAIRAIEKKWPIVATPTADDAVEPAEDKDLEDDADAWAAYDAAKANGQTETA